MSVCPFVCFSFTCVALDCPVCGLGVPAAVPLRCVCFEPQVPGSPTCGGWVVTTVVMVMRTMMMLVVIIMVVMISGFKQQIPGSPGILWALLP